jgi:hypothetical protein
MQNKSEMIKSSEINRAFYHFNFLSKTPSTPYNPIAIMQSISTANITIESLNVCEE